MNRIIKFRAWDKDKGEMISWEELSKTYSSFLNTPNDWLYDVMQFTGLKDKNGKEIYEGDIVRGGMGKLFEVGFGDGAFVLIQHEGKVIFGFYHFFEEKHGQAKVGLGDAEVIGNIYENPELLKL